jgi:transcriptional regulator with XRE-family HTH domain
MTRIGERLREERNRLRFSQSAMGAIGGVETNAQGNYESGSRSPKASYLEKIATAGVDINYVVTGFRTARLTSSGQTEAYAGLAGDPTMGEHLTKVTHQLHRNLHGIIDALYQMTVLVDSRLGTRDGDEIRSALDTIKLEAESLAAATVRLVTVTAKLA